MGGILPTTDKMVAILEDLRSSVVANKKGRVAIEAKGSDATPEKIKEEVSSNELPISGPLPICDDLEIAKKDKILELPAPRKELVFMPLALQSSWMPRKGNPDVYIRKFRSSTIITSQGYTPSGCPVKLPSGLMSRRILLSLITMATQNQSPCVEVPSIKALLNWSGLVITGRSHKSCQRNLFQMAMMNLDLWFQPGERKATIYKGNIFNKIEVTIEQDNQQQFSFIPNEVIFDDSFYQSVIKNKAVPYNRDEVMRASSAYEHDLIMWLYQRQSQDYLQKPVHLNYSLMQEQFGTSKTEKPAMFRHRFKKELRNVIKKHGRKIDINKDGIILHPMSPVVPYKRQVGFSKFY